jgi:hypothetical protein
MLKTTVIPELATKTLALYKVLGEIEQCDIAIRAYAEHGNSGTVHDLEHKQMREVACKKVQEITAVIFTVVNINNPKTTAEQERDELLTILRDIVYRDSEGIIHDTYRTDIDLGEIHPTLEKWIPQRKL